MGYSRKGVGGHCNGHSRGIYAGLLVCLLCLSVSQSAAPQPASKLQDGSNLEIGSATNKAELQRAEAGWEKRQKRTEARAGDIHLNLEGGGEM